MHTSATNFSRSLALLNSCRSGKLYSEEAEKKRKLFLITLSYHKLRTVDNLIPHWVSLYSKSTDFAILSSRTNIG